VDASANVGIGTTSPLARLHVEGANESVLATALDGEELVVEAPNAVVGLYSRDDMNFGGSAIVLGEVLPGGALWNKWAIVRDRTLEGNRHLRFTFGSDPDYANNRKHLTLTEFGAVKIGAEPENSFYGGLLDVQATASDLISGPVASFVQLEDQDGVIITTVSSTATTLWVNGIADSAPAGGGIVLIGQEYDLNLSLDQNEIMARDDGVGAVLYLNREGGDVVIGNLSPDDVGIGRFPTTNDLEVEGTASKTTAGDWLANSDARIKTDVETIHGALETLEQVRLVSFHYTDEYRTRHPSIEDRAYINVIAQEFAEVFPNYVKGSGETLSSGEEILQVDPYPLTIYSAAAIQELHDRMKEKDARIAELQAQLDGLGSRLQRLEARINSP